MKKFVYTYHKAHGPMVVDKLHHSRRSGLNIPPLYKKHFGPVIKEHFIHVSKLIYAEWGLPLYQMSNIQFLLSPAVFSKLTFSKKSFRNTIIVSNCLDPDQDQHSVDPDLGPNCLKMLSADEMKKVNKQCLLDTPRTVRFSVKLVKVKFKPADLSFEKKISVESVQKIINSSMHMFNVSTLYRQSIKLLHQKLW